jgi:hypothetical protein
MSILSDAYHLGATHGRGQGAYKNPFEPGTTDHTDYESGWTQGFRLSSNEPGHSKKAYVPLIDQSYRERALYRQMAKETKLPEPRPNSYKAAKDAG